MAPRCKNGTRRNKKTGNCETYPPPHTPPPHPPPPSKQVPINVYDNYQHIPQKEYLRKSIIHRQATPVRVAVNSMFLPKKITAEYKALLKKHSNKKVYHLMSLKYHPDRNIEYFQEASNAQALINSLYNKHALQTKRTRPKGKKV